MDYRSLLISLVLLVCVSQPTSSFNFIKEVKKTLARYAHYEHWALSPLGSAMSGFINWFITASISPQIKDSIGTKYSKNWRRYTANAFKYTFIKQIPLAIAVCIGLLIALVLIAFPCLVASCRKKQRTKESYSKSKGKGWCLFVCALLCVVIAVFGAVIAGYSSFRTYYTLKAPFKYNEFALKIAFEMKKMLQHNYQYRLHEISRTASDQITLLYNVNEDIIDAFNVAMKGIINPLLNIASTMEWQIGQAKYTLQNQKTSLYNLLNNTSVGVKTLSSQISTAVKELQKSANESASTRQLYSLLHLPELEISGNETEVFDEPIKALRAASKLNLPSSIQEMNLQLNKLIQNTSYDPSELMTKLSNSVFKQEFQIGDKVAKYIAFVNQYVRENEKNHLLLHASNMETDVLNFSYFAPVFLFVLCSLCLICIVISFLGFFVGAIGLDGCSFKSKRSQGANRSFKVLLVCIYIVSLFVWICFASSVLLFFMAALPLQYCQSWRDMTFFSSTIDNPYFLNHSQWFNAYTFQQYSLTFKDSIVNCMEDERFFPPLPDPLIDSSDADVLKQELNFSSEINAFKEGLADLPKFNISSSVSTIVNISQYLDKVDTVDIFKPLNDFLASAKNKTAEDALIRIKDNPDSSSKVSSEAEIVLEAYRYLIDNVTAAIAEGEPYGLSIKSINLTLLTVSKQMDYLNWTSDTLHEFITDNSTTLYSAILEQTVSSKIDGIFFDLLYEASQFRNAMSMCKTVLIMYDKGDVVVCKIILNPLAVAWLGFFLLSVSLVGAVLCAAVLIPPDIAQTTDNTDDQGQASAAEDK